MHGCLRTPQSYRAAASLAPSKARAGAGDTGRWRLCRKEADASSGHHLAQAKAPKEDIPPSAPQVLGHRLQLGLWGSVPVLKLLLPDTLFIPEGSCPHARTGSASSSGTSASNRSDLKATKQYQLIIQCPRARLALHVHHL